MITVLCPDCREELSAPLPDPHDRDLSQLVGDAVIATIMHHSLWECLGPPQQFPRYWDRPPERYTLDSAPFKPIDQR